MWFKFPQSWQHSPWYDRSSCNYRKHSRWETNLEYLICLFVFLTAITGTSGLKCNTWNLVICHLLSLLCFFPCSSCITCYFVQPVVNYLPGDPLWHGIWAECLGITQGERANHCVVTAEERALSLLGTPFSSYLTPRASGHCYAPSHDAEQDGWQLCSSLILVYFSCHGCKAINFLWKIRTCGEKRLFDGGVGYNIFDISNIKLLKQADNIKCGEHKSNWCEIKYYFRIQDSSYSHVYNCKGIFLNTSVTVLVFLLPPWSASCFNLSTVFKAVDLLSVFLPSMSNIEAKIINEIISVF